MPHISIALKEPIEFIEIQSVNPLISKCQIKVLYVSEEPNRNGSVITKEVATKIAESLPGSPIVGFYNKETQDFEGHNRDFHVNEDGSFYFDDTTKPYGFVDLNAKVWFQKFLDDNQVEREYLVTEGYLWTQYPEVERILTNGNNQSMELDEKTLKGQWAKKDNNKFPFFIINEAIISKLCILGEDIEPCFEGANITSPAIQFSFNKSFKEDFALMMSKIDELLKSKGGKNQLNEKEMDLDTLEVDKDPVNIEDFEKKDDSDKEENSKKKKVCDECGKPMSECTCRKEKDKKNYEALECEFSDLKTKFEALITEKADLESKVKELTSFYNSVQKEKKQRMIDSFYMLSAEDKKEVIDNIDKYSVDEIESKLSVICVRNKVSFSKEDADKKAAYIFNLQTNDNDVNTPEWVLSAREVAKIMEP